MFGTIGQTNVLILTAAGALFSLAGLALLFRRGGQESEHYAEFLGLKFRFSSTGLVVFLVGPLFFSTPIFFNVDQTPSLADPSSTPARRPASETAAASPPGSAPQSSAKEQSTLQGREQEANNKISEANRIDIGKSYRGTVSKENPDFFLFTNTDYEKKYWFKIRVINYPASVVNAYLVNENEETIFSLGDAGVGTDYSTTFTAVEIGEYYIRITCMTCFPSDQPSYEMTLRPE